MRLLSTQICLLALLFVSACGRSNEAQIPKPSEMGDQGTPQTSEDELLQDEKGDPSPAGDTEQPEEPAKPAAPLEEVPKGVVGDEGLGFVVPYDRGAGSMVLSRQNGYLRVDVEVVYPYSPGDGTTNTGSSVEIALSVSGLAGRKLVFYPSPLWSPSGGMKPAFRREAPYSKTEVRSWAAVERSFVGRGDVSYWDRWKATLFINLAYVLVPGNSPLNKADSWRLSAVTGIGEHSAAFPTGADMRNPANTPARMVSFTFSELPEREAEEADPLETLEAGEKSLYEAMEAFEKQATGPDGKLVDLYGEVLRYRKEFPRQLMWHDLACKFVLHAREKNVEGISHDALGTLKEMVDFCPALLVQQVSYLIEIQKEKGEEASATRFRELLKSPLATGSEITGNRVRLHGVLALYEYGAVKTALEELPPLLKVKVEDVDAVRARIQCAVIMLQENMFEEASGTLVNLKETEFVKGNPQALAAVKNYAELAGNASKQWSEELEFQKADQKKKNPRVTLETSKGKIVIELFEDDAPNTTASFVDLVKKEFYNGLTFHRYEPNFVIQGGCPLGNGTGDAGYKLKAEISRRNHFRGTVGMARSADPDSQGSQFYICTKNSPSTLSLSGKYVVVGRVIEGMDVAEKLRKGDKMTKVTVDNLREHEYKPKVIKTER